MSATLRSLLALANASRARFGLAVVLGAVAVVLGVGLMAMAGYRRQYRPASK